MVKRCQWGLCNSDSRYPERLEGGILFTPFPKPKRSLDKCLRWIKACGRPHRLLNTEIIDGNYHLYVCTKHFIDGKPTKENPDPMPFVPESDSSEHTQRKSDRRLSLPPKEKKTTSQDQNPNNQRKMNNATFCEIKVEVFGNDDDKFMVPVMENTETENTDISRPSIGEVETGNDNIAKIPAVIKTNVNRLSKSQLDDNIIKIALDASQPSVVDTKGTVQGAFKQDEVILNLIEPQAQRTAYMSLYSWNTWRAHTMQLKKTNFEYIPYFYELCNQRIQYIDTMLAYFVLSCKNKPMNGNLIQTILSGLQTYINTFTHHFNKKEVRFNSIHQFPKYEEALKFKVQPFKTSSVLNPENVILQTEPSLQTTILQVSEQPTPITQTIPMPRIEKISQKSTTCTNILPKILPKLAFVNKHHQPDKCAASCTAVQQPSSKTVLRQIVPSTEVPHSGSGTAESTNGDIQPDLNTDSKGSSTELERYLHGSSEHQDDNEDTETDVPKYIIIKQEPIDDMEYNSVAEENTLGDNPNGMEHTYNYLGELKNNHTENCDMEKSNLSSDGSKRVSNKRKATNHIGAGVMKVARVNQDSEMCALNGQHDSEQRVEHSNDNVNDEETEYLHNAEIEYRFYNDSSKKLIKQEIEFRDEDTTMFSCCERNKTGRTVSDMDINLGDYLPENCIIRPSDVNLKRVVFPDGGKMTIKLKYKLDR